jgi:hypothetical protein
MRRIAVPLLVTFWVCCPTVITVAGAEDTDRALAVEVATRFAKAINAQRLDDLMKAADVPWWSGDDDLTTDRDALKTLLTKALKSWKDRKFPTKVTAVLTYGQVREKVEDEKTRTVLDKVLAQSDRVVQLGEHALLVRVRHGKARVVGGAR